MVLFLVLPILMMVYVSFWTQTTFKIEPILTTKSWQAFFASDTYLGALWTTIRIWLDRARRDLPGGLPDGALRRPVRPQQDDRDRAAGALRHPVLDLVPDPRARLAADARQGRARSTSSCRRCTSPRSRSTRCCSPNCRS